MHSQSFLISYFFPLFSLSQIPFFSPSLLCRVYPGSSVIAIWHQKILLVLSCKQSAPLIIILDYSVQSFYFSDCVSYFCISPLQSNEWYVLVKYTRDRWLKPPERHIGLYLVVAYNLWLWSMIEFLVFNFKNVILWKVFGYRGLDSLGITGTVDDLGDHM